MVKLYGSLQVIALTGVSHRQLQWWDEHGMVVPERNSHRRVYTSMQVLLIMTILAMRSKGITPDAVRSALPPIERELKKADLRNALLLVGMSGHTRIHKHAATLVYEMADALDQPCWVIDLSQFWGKILDDSNIGVSA